MIFSSCAAPRQNSAFCVSDFKIDAHGAASSVGERNSALDATMLL